MELPKLTPLAEAKASELIARESNPDLMLRLSVQPGGCSGLRYNLFFDMRLLPGDETEEYEGVTLVVDHMSVPYLTGAVIDYADSIEKQGFSIANENAAGTCACGDSFH